MATQYAPIAKDSSINTTEQTPRNIADVLAEELSAIEQAIAGGSGSGGHVIEDTNGTALTQRADLQFVGVYTEDDSTNDRTKVNIVRPMSAAEMRALSPAERVGFIRTTDEPDNPYQNDVERFFSEEIYLNSLTWSQAGKYYSTIPTPSALTGKTLLAVNISDWDELSATVLINLYIRENNSIGILSNTGSFSASSYIKLCLLYR